MQNEICTFARRILKRKPRLMSKLLHGLRAARIMSDHLLETKALDSSLARFRVVEEIRAIYIYRAVLGRECVS